MRTFVAREGDLAAERALSIIGGTPWLGCPTRVLSPVGEDGVAGSEDIVFFTGDSKMRFPSRWLRTSPSHVDPHRPVWAMNAKRAIAIRLRDDIHDGDGFEAAVLDIVSTLTGFRGPSLPKQPKKRSRGRYFNRARW